MTVPLMTGTTMPKRSASRPISAPPKAKPVNARVKGSDALARSIPNSAWTAGSATTADHMPTQPMVPMRSATARRNQAYGDSVIVVLRPASMVVDRLHRADGRRRPRDARRFELPSPRARLAVPCRHVLDLGWAERAGMEKPAVVIGIEMVRLHEPHQVHGVDVGREAAIGFVDVAAHRLGAGEAGIARRARDRTAILGIRHRVRLRLARAPTRYPRECRIDGGVHAWKIGRAKAFEDAVEAHRVGAGGLIRATHHAGAERLHHLERQKAAMHPAAQPHRLGREEDVVADHRRLAEAEVTGL